MVISPPLGLVKVMPFFVFYFYTQPLGINERYIIIIIINCPSSFAIKYCKQCHIGWSSSRGTTTHKGTFSSSRKSIPKSKWRFRGYNEKSSQDFCWNFWRHVKFFLSKKKKIENLYIGRDSIPIQKLMIQKKLRTYRYM